MNKYRNISAINQIKVIAFQLIVTAQIRCGTHDYGDLVIFRTEFQLIQQQEEKNDKN